MTALVDERRKLGRVVGVFGIAFVIGTFLNFTKAQYFSKFEELLLEKTGIFYVATLAANLLIDIIPISMIYFLHRSNFDQADFDRLSEREGTGNDFFNETMMSQA